MGFKLIFILTIILGLVACQEIDDIQPKPIVLNKPKQIIYDSVYVSYTCSSPSKLYNESFFQTEFMIASQAIFKYSDRMSIYFEDNNGNYLEIFMKRQNLVPKTFTLIPYENTFNFNNYNEAMILFHGISYSNDFFAQSGKFNFESPTNLGFCNATFTDQYKISNFKLSFTW